MDTETTTDRGAARWAARASALRAPALVGLAGAGSFALLHLHDPHESGSYGYCPFLFMTGLPCPGCGSLRAVNDLTRGDLVGAVSSNVLLVALVVVLAVSWVLWVGRRWRGRIDRMIVVPPNVALALLGVLVVFGVVRNLPFGAWLAP